MHRTALGSIDKTGAAQDDQVKLKGLHTHGALGPRWSSYSPIRVLVACSPPYPSLSPTRCRPCAQTTGSYAPDKGFKLYGGDELGTVSFKDKNPDFYTFAYTCNQVHTTPPLPSFFPLPSCTADPRPRCPLLRRQ
jgi:hypothetical protein